MGELEEGHVTVAQIIGILLMAIGALSLLVLLYQDATKKPTSITSNGFDWQKILALLPIRYLPSVITILLGYAMFDPAGFKAIFG
jgi:hypothetical protein